MPTDEKNSLIQALLDICFPPKCLSCDERLGVMKDILFCPDCLARIEFVEEPFCLCCGRVFLSSDASHLCGACLIHPRHFTCARSVFLYEEPFSRALHAFKYEGKMNGLQTFYTFKREKIQLRLPFLPDILLPVPLHKRRLRERGFNQALILARTLFPELRMMIAPDLLFRSRYTEPQTNLSGSARRKNVRGAFFIRRPEFIKGKNILLVDDVFTTGTTVDECARVLKDAGAATVQVFTLARVRDL